MSGIYIHIPFCGSRCGYCAFYSTVPRKDSDIQLRYAESLISELKRRRQEVRDTVKTIYFGGGTPSLMPTLTIQTILETIYANYTVADNAEITLEGNPEDLTRDYLAALYACGINRLSMGVQSFDDNLLRFMGRRHNSRRATDAVSDAQAAGFRNITIDLMYAIPGQTQQMWIQDLDKALALPIKHLSAYCLTIESGTPFEQMLRQGRILLPDDDTCNTFYDILLKKTANAGFLQYETSNFAQQGYHSRHNSAYWDGTPYLGVGAAAHSYDGVRTRRWNVSDLARYIEHEDCHEAETLTGDELYNEAVMLGLRRTQGIELEMIREKFGAERLEYCLKAAKRYIESGKLAVSDGHLHVTCEGMKVLNMITEELFV